MELRNDLLLKRYTSKLGDKLYITLKGQIKAKIKLTGDAKLSEIIKSGTEKEGDKPK